MDLPNPAGQHGDYIFREVAFDTLQRHSQMHQSLRVQIRPEMSHATHWLVFLSFRFDSLTRFLFVCASPMFEEFCSLSNEEMTPV